MKKRNTIVLLFSLLLLILAIFFVFNRSTSTIKNKVKDFAVQDTASVSKVFLADKNNKTILLERQSNGEWLLNKTYIARSSAILMLFETFKNIVPRYPVPRSAHDNVVSQLAARSIKVEIYQEVYRIDIFGMKLFPHEKLTKTYYVGGATADNQGTFMLMEGADMPFVVQLLGFRGFIGPRYSTIVKDWRDHTVFKTKLSEINTVIMEMPEEPENSYKITSKNRELTLTQLASNKVVPSFDTLKLLNFLTSFNDLRYEALLDDIRPYRKDSIMRALPKNILTVINNKGDTTQMTAWFKPNDNQQVDVEGKLYVHDLDRMYAMVNDKKDFVLIQYYVFDKVLKPLSYFTK